MENSITNISQQLKINPEGFIAEVEEEYHQRIKNTAEKIVSSGKRIILLAGPSASGKTTTSHLLCNYLKESGVQTEIISLDDFYLEHNQMPYDEQGVIDFESVHSLDTEGIIKALNDINSEGKTDLPVFSFITKSREKNSRHIDIGKDGAVIVEGLHALNPIIADCLPRDRVMKLYISVTESYCDDSGEEILKSRNIRLMRRMSRDILYRDSTPESCLTLFLSVTRGEEKYLHPYRSTADIQMCSFHDYEICVLKPLLFNILKALPSTVDNFERVEKIINAMEIATEISTKYVPKSSLLSEFIG